MLGFILSLLSLFSSTAFCALEYSKVEYPGCPENAYCLKNTGEVRQKWLGHLENFNKDKISESKMNSEIQKSFGIPVSGWAQEEAAVLPRIMMWDSPCGQHKKEATKFYISELFMKSLSDQELKNVSNVYFPRAVGIDSNKKIYSMPVPRGEIPAFSENGSLYFLKDDDGKYYGLLINREGVLKVTKPSIVKELPKDVVCLKEQVDLFLREAPSTSFFQGYHCKNIWDKTSKTYKSMLFGWSCN